MSGDQMNAMHDAAVKAVYSGATSHSFFFHSCLIDEGILMRSKICNREQIYR